MTSGKVTHGPVAGVMAQFITVDGHDESNADLSTALGYEDQYVTVLTGRIGYQAAWEVVGPLAPHARMIYQHETTNGADAAFARSLSLDQTDVFAVPGADLDTQFVTATNGMQGRIGGMQSDFGATATIGQGEGAEISAVFGLSHAFQIPAHCPPATVDAGAIPHYLAGHGTRTPSSAFRHLLDLWRQSAV